MHEALVAGARPRPQGPLAASATFGWRTLLRIKHVPEQLFDVTAFPMMMTLIFTMYTGVALNTDIWKGVFDRIRSLPVWRPSALVGAPLGDVLRFTLASAAVIGLGLLLGFRPDGGPLGVLTAVGLLLVITPLTFGSNIFVDPATMPGWLQAFVDVNPVSHLVTAIRGLMHGEAVGGDVLMVFAWAALLVAVLGPLTMRRYGNRS